MSYPRWWRPVTYGPLQDLSWRKCEKELVARNPGYELLARSIRRTSHLPWY